MRIGVTYGQEANSGDAVSRGKERAPFAVSASFLPLQATPYAPSFMPEPPSLSFFPAGSETLFLERLQQIMREAARSEGCGALLLLNINNFAMVISGYGHTVSELVMNELIGRLREMLSPLDAVSRLQRDQIGIALSNSTPDQTEQTAQRIMQLLQHYGRDNFATASLHIMGVIGSVHFPQETKDPADALDKAYIALHSPQGSPYRSYAATQAQADYSRQQMGLASYLFNAFKEERLRLAWQPIVEVATGTVSHYEALLRIKSTMGRISSAGALIPVAEKMGLIEDIDIMVLEMAVRELRHCPHINIAFNISNLTSESAAWLSRVQKLVTETPDIAPRMMVEITETAVQRDLRRSAYFVANLQALGCLVALDDFGSGYTSFRQLKALSVDVVKIDGVFIKDIAQNADSRFFVKTLLDFTQGFGLKTVAEFVETGEIAKILMDMGVDYLQGYYLGKPENHRSWLKEGEYGAD